MNDRETSNEIGVQDAVRVLRRRIGTVLLVTALFVFAALVLNARAETVYNASTEILVDLTTGNPLDPNGGAPADPERALQNELRFAQSRVVREAVQEQLGMLFARVSIAASSSQDVLTITSTANTPEDAARMANVYAETYLDTKVESRRAEYLETAAIFERRIADLEAQIAELQAAGNETDVQALVNQRNVYRQQLENMRLNADLLERTRGQVIRAALPPGEPSSPQPTRDLGVALLAGLVVGSGLAFAREFVDDSITSTEDLAQAAGDIPRLAVIPRGKRSGPNDVASISAPDGPVAEAYRSLRTSLSFISFDSDLRAVQVTSAVPGEGKTTTVANLAVALARAGELVVVVDADLRRPRLHELFRTSSDLGLSSVLSGRAGLPDVVRPVRGDDFELFFVPAGPVPPNSSELLSSPNLGEIVKTLRGDADIVLFDSAPLLPVSDARVLSRALDATIVVARSGASDKSELRSAVTELNQVGSSVVGTVLVDADEEHLASTVRYDPRPTSPAKGWRKVLRAGSGWR